MDVKYDRKAIAAEQDERTGASKAVTVSAAEEKEAIEMDEVKGRLEGGEAVQRTTAELKAIFGEEHVTLMESYTHSARYQVGRRELSIADVFEHMESIKGRCEILNYAVSQISLEQIFLGFAKEQREEDGEKGIEDDRSRLDRFLAAAFGCCVIG